MCFSCTCHLWWHTYVAPRIACDTHWLLKTVVGRIQNTAKWFLLSHSQNQKTPEKFQEFWLCSYQSQLILGCASKLQNHKLITISVWGLVFSRLIGFLLATQQHNFHKVIFWFKIIHGFVSFTVKGFEKVSCVWSMLLVCVKVEIIFIQSLWKVNQYCQPAEFPLLKRSFTQLLHWAPLPQNHPQNLMVTKEIKYKLPLFILGNVLIAIILLWPRKFLKQIIQIKLYKVKNPNW